jgi:hypothetical protein
MSDFDVWECPEWNEMIRAHHEERIRFEARQAAARLRLAIELRRQHHGWADEVSSSDARPPDDWAPKGRLSHPWGEPEVDAQGHKGRNEA